MAIKLIIDESLLGYSERIVVEVNGNTVGDCLNYFIKKRSVFNEVIFDETGCLWLHNLVRVNGDFIYSNPLLKPVKDGDEIEIIKYSGG